MQNPRNFQAVVRQRYRNPTENLSQNRALTAGRVVKQIVKKCNVQRHTVPSSKVFPNSPSVDAKTHTFDGVRYRSIKCGNCEAYPLSFKLFWGNKERRIKLIRLFPKIEIKLVFFIILKFSIVGLSSNNCFTKVAKN